MTLLLFTNSKVLEQGFLTVFAGRSPIETVIVNGAPADVLDSIARHAPSVLLFDFIPAEHFPALAEIRRRAPACPIVLWMDAVSPEAGYQAMKLGVRGILKKSDAIDHAISLLVRTSEGQLCFEQGLVTRFLESRTVGLTPRESQLVPLIARGLKNKEIASALQLSDATVRIYLSALFRKLGVHDRHELAIYAQKNLFSDRFTAPVLRSMLLGKAAGPFAPASS